MAAPVPNPMYMAVEPVIVTRYVMNATALMGMDTKAMKTIARTSLSGKGFVLIKMS